MNKTCPPCHGDCNQGRACPNDYRANFDHLGNPIHQTPPPWTVPDLLVCVLFVLSLICINQGIFK